MEKINTCCKDNQKKNYWPKHYNSVTLIVINKIYVTFILKVYVLECAGHQILCGCEMDQTFQEERI